MKPAYNISDLRDQLIYYYGDSPITPNTAYPSRVVYIDLRVELYK